MERPRFGPPVRHQTDIRQMCDDMITAAQLVEAPYDRDRLWAVLYAYRDYFSGSPVSFATNTRPPGKRSLTARYIELDMPHDAYAIALAEGFITKQGHPVDELLPALQGSRYLLGYGVDVDAARGLKKIWPFFGDYPTIDEIAAMHIVPDSIRTFREVFARYDLRIVSLFAVDFSHRTMNVYFMIAGPGRFPPDRVAALIGDLGLQLPAAELLEHCSRAVTIYPTFSWDSPSVERLCFGMVAPVPALAPVHLHPVIARYVAEVPILGPDRRFIYSITPGRTESYIKIESDYTCSMMNAMQAGAQAVA